MVVGSDLVRVLWHDGPRTLVRGGLGFLGSHSGPTATALASIFVGLSYRWARKIARVAAEVAVCAALLGALTHFGVLTW